MTIKEFILEDQKTRFELQCRFEKAKGVKYSEGYEEYVLNRLANGEFHYHVHASFPVIMGFTFNDLEVKRTRGGKPFYAINNGTIRYYLYDTRGRNLVMNNYRRSEKNES